VYVGSGVAAATVAEVLRLADGVIVGTSLKHDGRVASPVDPARAWALVAAARR
jgi:predicted TIM-barrel enzyme